MAREYDYEDMVAFYAAIERHAAKQLAGTQGMVVALNMRERGLPTDDSFGTIDYPELR